MVLVLKLIDKDNESLCIELDNSVLRSGLPLRDDGSKQNVGLVGVRNDVHEIDRSRDVEDLQTAAILRIPETNFAISRKGVELEIAEGIKKAADDFALVTDLYDEWLTNARKRACLQAGFHSRRTHEY